MANFYGSYIGYGASAAGSAGGVYIGGRGLIGGGNYGFLDVIEYTTIASEGNGINFGDLVTGRYGLSACAGGATASTRGIFMGGETPAYQDLIDYITIATIGGDAIDFIGNLTVARDYAHGCSNGVRGLNMGGYSSVSPNSYDTIDYVTIDTTGTCLDFGNLDVGRYGTACCSNGTLGIEAGGYPNDGSNDIIQYVTIATTGDAVDWGDNLLEARYFAVSCSNSTRGLFAGGSAPGNTIQYITMATTGTPAVDFGNLTAAREGMGAYASETRGVMSGGHPHVYSNQIQFVTIASLGDAANFGDLLTGKGGTLGGCSGD